MLNQLYRALAGLGLVTLLVSGSYLYGRHAERATLTAKNAVVLAKAEKVGTELAAKLAIQKQINAQTYVLLNEEIPHAIVYVGIAPTAAHDLRLSADLVGLWNAALSATPPAGGPAGATAGTNSATTITAEDAIRNHVANAEQCRNVAEQLDALITWVLQNTKKTGPS